MAPITSWLAAMLVAAATVHASYTVPTDLADGVYEVTYNEAGEASHTKLAEIDAGVAQSNPTAGRYALSRRAGNPEGVTCENDAGVFDSVLAQTAIANLANSCERGGDKYIPGRWRAKPGIKFAKSMDHIAFVCNYSQNSQSCKASELTSDTTAILAQCKNGAGWYAHKNWAKNYGLTWNNGKRFCW